MTSRPSTAGSLPNVVTTLWQLLDPVPRAAAPYTGATMLSDFELRAIIADPSRSREEVALAKADLERGFFDTIETGGGGILGDVSRGLGRVAASKPVKVAAPIAGTIAVKGLAAMGVPVGGIVKAFDDVMGNGPVAPAPVAAPPVVASGWFARLLAFLFPR